MGLKLGQAKFQPFTLRKTFSNRELNGQGVRKKFFQQKTAHTLETVKDTED